MGAPFRFIPPRTGGGYTLDLDASLRYTREASSFPIGLGLTRSIGYVQGLLPQMDHLVAKGLYAKTPFGPWMGVPPSGRGNAAEAFADEKTTFSELPKVSG